MKKALLYIHGKGGTIQEANHYQTLLEDYVVIGLDYKKTTPWETKEEFLNTYHHLSKNYTISLLANSIGAYFAMNALAQVQIEKAFFISPIVDMEKLITDMLTYNKITEEQLQKEQIIPLPSGEILSWEYLSYVRSHPIKWDIPTDILYGEKDNLTSLQTMKNFAKSHNATLTVMKNGKHWFHTTEQMKFLNYWLIQHL